ncbi:hypothetical protein LZ757_06815 [Xylella fastidiosa subsp. morus]|uniref:Uncharacterized protein n=1 Tax=Xylella fastidiosa subsp. multiplex TaxID=644357 RepID=A0AAW6HUG6_XYLFS|nr:hypothetical protein [Xylella fastidiosa]EWG14259.1 bifunctional phosphoribosylaminoimidazolecarboxamide formyltransferase/IMP cyclohydrolase [Xylella fastidiosa Mul-MD]KFA40710.1 bifunctional phosphoribosylaminoimidazolecarboxamide formyltransferase/IMP cyclohydrolase [Xylella fastidiosa]MCP8325345.1 hypothetical protein [Xylella fastidiosa subsp. multiplex]MDC6408409.1 hypothetical protein [Xylella fastidiosa subsp. multiplex]MDC6409792.1 hypothetical protein [Xylella fastidiosa subsp. mu
MKKRFGLAVTAFHHVAQYDAAISNDARIPNIVEHGRPVQRPKRARKYWGIGKQDSPPMRSVKRSGAQLYSMAPAVAPASHASNLVMEDTRKSAK